MTRTESAATETRPVSTATSDAPDDAATPEHDYARDLFGGNTIDADGDCQNMRAEVLIAESSTTPVLEGCTVFAGAWDDPWSSDATTNTSDLDVDHTVPLANAWRSGAWAWSGSERIAYANDVADTDHLLAIPLSENRAKSDSGPEAWRPPDRAAWCHYAEAWSRIKARWNLVATPAEWDALVAMSAGC